MTASFEANRAIQAWPRRAAQPRWIERINLLLDRDGRCGMVNTMNERQAG
jgi:hypothetical protein